MSLETAIDQAIRQAIEATRGDERRMYQAIDHYRRTGSQASQYEAAKYYNRLSYEAKRRADFLGDLVGTASQCHY